MDQYQKENVKKSLTKDSLFRHYLIENPKDGKNVKCCFGIHEDNSPSLSVKDCDAGILFNCFSCGVSGDSLSFIALKENLDLISNFKEIMEIASSISGVGEPKKYDYDISKLKTSDERAIDEIKKSYFEKKKIKLDMFPEITYIKNDNGYFDFAYPMKNAFGEIVGHQTGSKVVVSGSSCGFFFREIDMEKKITFIEGLSDYLSTMSSGVQNTGNVVGLYSVSLRDEDIKQLIDNFYTNYGKTPKVVFALDYDGFKQTGEAKSIKSGFQGTKKAMNLAISMPLNTTVKFVSTTEKKDVSDIFVEEGAEGVNKFFESENHSSLESVNSILTPKIQQSMNPLMISLVLNKIYEIASENGNMWACHRGIWTKMLENEPEKFVKDYIREKTKIPAEVSVVSKVTKHLLQEATGKGRSLVEALSRGEEYYNRHKNFVFFEDYRYNVLTKEKLPYQPSDYIYSTLEGTCDFDHGKCPRFLKFLDEIFSGDEDKQKRIEFMQELYGYCMYPHTPFEKMFIWVGSGGNGKGVLMETLGSLVGAKNRKNLEMSRLEIDKFSISELVGCYVNSCSEEKKGMNLGSPILKMLTGGDTLTAARKFSTDIDYKPFCKVIISLNDDPSITEDAAWLERRLMLLRFNNNFDNWQKGVKGDPDLKVNLKKEIVGIRKWAIEGLARLLERGAFTEPKSVIDDTSSFVRRNTRILQFFLRKMKVMITQAGGNKVISAEDCYRLYKQYCTDCHGGAANFAYSYETFMTKFEKFVRPFAEIKKEDQDLIVFDSKRMNEYFDRNNLELYKLEEEEETNKLVPVSF